MSLQRQMPRSAMKRPNNGNTPNRSVGFRKKAQFVKESDTNLGFSLRNDATAVVFPMPAPDTHSILEEKLDFQTGSIPNRYQNTNQNLIASPLDFGNSYEYQNASDFQVFRADNISTSTFENVKTSPISDRAPTLNAFLNEYMEYEKEVENIELHQNVERFLSSLHFDKDITFSLPHFSLNTEKLNEKIDKTYDDLKTSIEEFKTFIDIHTQNIYSSPPAVLRELQTVSIEDQNLFITNCNKIYKICVNDAMSAAYDKIKEIENITSNDIESIKELEQGIANAKTFLETDPYIKKTKELENVLSKQRELERVPLIDKIDKFSTLRKLTPFTVTKLTKGKATVELQNGSILETEDSVKAFSLSAQIWREKCLKEEINEIRRKNVIISLNEDIVTALFSSTNARFEIKFSITKGYPWIHLQWELNVVRGKADLIQQIVSTIINGLSLSNKPILQVCDEIIKTFY